MKNKGIIIFLIIILTLGIVSLSLFTYDLIKNNKDFNIDISFASNYKELVVDKEYDINYENIDLKMNVGDVYVKPSTNDKIGIKVYASSEDVFLNEDNERLTIEVTNNSCKGICFFNKSSKIELYVPVSLVSNVNIDRRTGDVSVSNLTNLIVTVTGNTGDIDVDGCNELVVSNDTGDVSVGTVNKANIKNITGDIKVGVVSILEVNNKTGDVKVETINGKLKIDNVTGDVKIGNVNLNESSSIKSDVGDVKIATTNDIYVDANTNIGDTTIVNKDRKSEIVLTITSRIGDIKVNY